MNLCSIFICFSILVVNTLSTVEDKEYESVQDANHKMFLSFMKAYNKNYASPREYSYRLNVFKSNMNRAARLQKEQKGTATYGVTKFSDLTLEEFREKHLGLGKTPLSNQKPLLQAEIPNVKLPKNFDWRDHNVVTEVKDQAMCGSCWTFSVTGNVEGQYAIKYSNLLSFSEQEIVDCDKLNSGCSGGWPSLAYQSLDNLGGLTLESDYPYTGTDNDCTFDESTSQVKVNGSVSLPVDEKAIAQWLYANGPLSICLNADDMQLYTSGISHPTNCNKYDLNHAVLLTGFGVKKVKGKKIPFWIIKNSWGTSWGEQGYYRVYRGAGLCGLDLMVSSALIV